MERKKYINETKLNQDEIVRLLAQQTLPLSRMLMSITSLLILMVVLILSWDKENNGLYITVTVMLSVGLIISVLLIIFKKWLVKISNKSLAMGVTYNYTFYENEFVVDSTIGDKTSHLVMQYEGLEKIVIKDDYAYLFINTVSIFFVDLNNFKEEKEEVINLFTPYKKKRSKR